MRVPISILSIFFISTMFVSSYFIQANDDVEESLLLSEVELELEENMDAYERQEILNAVEALAEDMENAERTENGYRIRLSPLGLATLGGITSIVDPAGGTSTQPKNPADLELERAADGGDDAVRAAAAEGDDVAARAAAARPPAPAAPARVPAAPARAVSEFHWERTILDTDSQDTMRRRFLNRIVRDNRSELNVRRLGRNRVIVGHSVDKERNLVLRFSRWNGNSVDIFECTNTRRLLTWFRMFGTFGSSCTSLARQVNTSTPKGAKILSGAIWNTVGDDFSIRTLRKGIFGGGFFYRWTKRLVILGVPVGIIGSGIYIAYTDDYQIEGVAEVVEESWEVLVMVVTELIEYLKNNERINSILDNENW